MGVAADADETTARMRRDYGARTVVVVVVADGLRDDPERTKILAPSETDSFVDDPPTRNDPVVELEVMPAAVPAAVPVVDVARNCSRSCCGCVVMVDDPPRNRFPPTYTKNQRRAYSGCVGNWKRKDDW